MTCGECNFSEIDMDSLKRICEKTMKEVDLNKKKCENFNLREDLLRERACCGVCEYMLMDEFCVFHDTYTIHTKLCDDFEACEEYIKGQI